MSGALLLRARQALLRGALEPDVDVLVEDGVITAVGRSLPDPGSSAAVAVLAPGFVDLHVHALDGRGMVGAGAPDVRGLSTALAARGVTGFLATTVTAPLTELTGVLAGDITTTGARCLGVHLEGPWLAATCAGAQPRAHLRTPDLADLSSLIAAGPPVLLTIAPELEGALELIEHAARAGVVVSLGHSAASYAEAGLGFEAGATHVTHCFNAMSPLHHRDPGLAGAALDRDGVTVEVIADGTHVHPAAVRMLWRVLRRGRLCLVSDAVDIAEAGGSDVATLSDGTLSGSRIGLDQMVRNLVAWGIPAADALTMASTTPAGVIGRPHEIAIGRPADLVLLDDDLRVASTLVDGRPV